MSKIQVNEIVNHFDNGAPDCPRGLTIAGVATATSLELTSLDVTGNVSVGGTLTYDDVTSIDSVGIITAQSGIHVGPLSGIACTITSAGAITATGAATFAGNITAVRGVFSDQVGTTNQLISNRAAGEGSSHCYQGQLNGTQTSVITADGDAEFTGTLQSRYLKVQTTETNPAYSVIDVNTGIATPALQVRMDGTATFAGSVYAGNRAVLDHTVQGATLTAGGLYITRTPSDTPIALYKTGDSSAKFSVDTSGNISCTGKITLKNSSGIQFGTSNTGTNITSQTLDDYEEGTWTPGIGGNATYTTQTGTYTKIGRFVFVTCDMIINLIGTGSTTAITTLPFSTAGGLENSSAVGYWSSLSRSVTSLVACTNATQVVFTETTSATSTSGLNGGIFQNGTDVRFSLCYRV